ncbi:COG4705 family protein [Deinococcus aquaticus]|uniref:COG4705 family protein n=1 Tax=Deinococcus aquaticus TaxID=328692 RepID=UPI003F4834A0
MNSTLSTEILNPVPSLWSKVPEVTAFFWIVKVMATTVGETAADYLNTSLHLGLTGTTLLMGVLLAAALVAQFRTKRYVPGVYWLAIVLISVVGTLITDNLTDNFGVSLWTSTVAFGVALIATFAVWYRREGTLSIHSIFTPRRELYYWLAILFTFALGTAAGDLMAETLQLGYLPSALIFAGAIAAVALARVFAGLNGVLAFWLAYIVTRPLGASIGDYLSQSHKAGGLGLGSTALNAIFLASILAVVTYLTVTRLDQVQSTEVSGPTVTG